MSKNIIDFNIHPGSAMVDTPLSIVVNGLNPKEEVSINAHLVDKNGNTFVSEAKYRADSTGKVDLSRLKPIDGSYKSIDSMGLLWSMKNSDNQIKDNVSFDLNPYSIHFKLTCEECSLEQSITRTWHDGNVTYSKVDHEKIRGMFFEPTCDGPHPTIILLNGSSGGIDENLACLFASHGYAVLALGYCMYEDLPFSLTNIPLEYFETAINFLKSKVSVDVERIAVYGVSYGGMLSLILGSLYPSIKSVIANVPSGISWGGVGCPRYIYALDFFAHSQFYLGFPGQEPLPSWTYKDKPYPFLRWADTPTAYIHEATKLCLEKKAIALTPMYLEAIKKASPEEIEENMIKSENTNGSILLLSGEDDKLWPSTLTSNLLIERLKAKNFKHQFKHVSYFGTGHVIKYPYIPLSQSRSWNMLYGTEFDSALGGEGYDAEVAYAFEDSWHKTLDFLKENL